MIGHEPTRQFLATTGLPRVVLFLGPASVGKWTLAEQLRRDLDIDRSTVVRVRSLTMDAARELTSLALTHGPRLIIIRLDGASDAAMNVLLKALEEADGGNRFILIASGHVLTTLMSRAQLHFFGLLSADQVKEILIERRFNPVEAERLAKASGGQVRTALALADNVDAKVVVLSALRCITERDADSLDNLAAKWTDDHTTLMARLCREAISRRWALFSEAEVDGLGRKLPLRILTALRADVRPRLVVRASLMSVLRGVA